MIGDIYRITMHDDNEGWVPRCVLVLELYEALPYNKSYLAARCLILDTGQRTNIYSDTLRFDGVKVA